MLRQRSALCTAVMLAAGQAAAQAPHTLEACSTLQIRSDEAVLLSRLCAESFYQRHEVAAADAACGAAVDKFTATESPMKELSAAGTLNDCVAESKRIEQLRILRWLSAYKTYRLSGHIAPPDPRIGKREGRTGATD